MITFVKSYHNTISGNITTDLKELSNEIKKNTEETYKVLHGIEDFQKEFTEFVSGKYHLPSNTRRPLCALASSHLPSERLYRLTHIIRCAAIFHTDFLKFLRRCLLDDFKWDSRGTFLIFDLEPLVRGIYVYRRPVTYMYRKSRSF